MTIFFIILMAILLLWGGIAMIDYHSYGFAVFVLGLFMIVPICYSAAEDMAPKEQDVLEGNAVYVETQHITNGDTIKTYHIEWKQ